MKYILLVMVFISSVFAAGDIYNIDNNAYVQDKKEFFLLQSRSKKQTKCITLSSNVKQMKKCLKR